MIHHKGHGHPLTPAARALCRGSGGDGITRKEAAAAGKTPSGKPRSKRQRGLPKGISAGASDSTTARQKREARLAADLRRSRLADKQARNAAALDTAIRETMTGKSRGAKPKAATGTKGGGSKPKAATGPKITYLDGHNKTSATATLRAAKARQGRPSTPKTAAGDARLAMMNRGVKAPSGPKLSTAAGDAKLARLNARTKPTATTGRKLKRK